MRWSHKITFFITCIPFIIFIFYSQTDYRKLYDENEKNKKKIKDLIINSPETKRAEAIKCYLEAKKNLNETQKMREEAKEAYIIAQRNNEYRNKLIADLYEKTESAKKHMNAFVKRDSFFEVEAFMTILPRKNSELYEAIERVQRLPLNALEHDLEMQKVLEEAMTVHKYIKNNL